MGDWLYDLWPLVNVVVFLWSSWRLVRYAMRRGVFWRQLVVWTPILVYFAALYVLLFVGWPVTVASRWIRFVITVLAVIPGAFADMLDKHEGHTP